MDPTLQLLGRPAVNLENEELEPAPNKISALLLYLACAGGWVPRDDLLYLLWPDTPEKKARNNLRQLLHRVGDVAWADALEREASRIRWRVESDLARFREAIDAGELDDAVERYRGPLLEGFRLGDAPEFDSWLELEREMLHAGWRSACLERARELRGARRAGEAAELLQRVLTRDPLDEEALRERLTALGEAGRRAEALVAFEAFVAQLEAELGIGPEPETDALADALRTGDLSRDPKGVELPAPTRGAARWRPPPLPAATGDFVGRAAELAELSVVLAERGVRLLSLVAPGGMGKTRLALALAARLSDRYADGAAFASFAATERPDRMEPVLADALGLTLAASEPPRDQLVGVLAERETLLVLDNLEHLTGDLSLVTTLLERCPRLAIVATSRERLALSPEWVYDLSGLTLPPPPPTTIDAPSGPRAAHAPDAPRSEELHRSDAVALFVRTAERVRGGLGDADPDLETVAAICRRVRGMPLAITLAAAWLRVLSLPEILDELERGLDLLESNDADTPERHRSVRTVFDATWRRLGPGERDAWAKLALLEGSFDRDAARAVAGVGLPLLLTLVNKAVVARNAGRFELHPLVRDYGRERAAALGVASEVRPRYAEHYLTWLPEHARAFEGTEQRAALQRATTELPNLRAAWDAAIELERATLLADASIDLMIYHEIFGLQHEFIPLVDRAVSKLLEAGDLKTAHPERQRAVGRLLPWATDQDGGYTERARRGLEIARRIGDTRGEAYARLYLAESSSGAELREHVAAGIARFEELGSDHGVARTEQLLGWPLVLYGNYREGVEVLERAAARFARLGDARLEASCYDGTAPAYIMLGEFERAEAAIERARRSNGEIAPWSDEVSMLGTLQWFEMERGNFEAAEYYQDRRVAYHERVGQDISANHRFLRAQLRYKQGAYDEARRLARTELLRQREKGQRHIGTLMLSLIVGRIALRENGAETAREFLREATAISLEFGWPRFLVDAAVAGAEWLHAEGRAPLAAELVAAARVDEATEIAVHREIERLLDAGLELPADTAPRDRDWLRATLRDVHGLAVPADPA